MIEGKRNINDRKYPQKPDLRRLVKTTEEEKESASHWIWSLFGYHSDRNTLRI